MGQHASVSGVYPGLIAAGPADSGQEVVGDNQRRDAGEVLEGLDIGADPVFEPLCPSRFGIRVVGCAQNSHEDLGLTDLARLAVDDRRAPAGVVDEHPLPGLAVLAYPDRPSAGPFAIQVAEPAVLAAKGIGPPVLVPDEEQRYVLALKLLGDLAPVGKRPVRRRDARRRGAAAAPG